LVEREFTVAVFVVHQGMVLLHWHRRLGLWLPPGGHIDPGELPDEAAVRETLEETGLAIELLDAPWGGPVASPVLRGPALPGPLPGSREPGAPRPEGSRVERAQRATLEGVENSDRPGKGWTLGPRRLAQPLGVQLEDISPGHQHIDLIYLARPRAPKAPAAPPTPGGALPPPALRSEAHNPEGRPGWFTPGAWRALPVTAEVDRWATAAVDACA
jgi:8-oxo-dGTP pyrophosphatase MutT (NUDIX family)